MLLCFGTSSASHYANRRLVSYRRAGSGNRLNWQDRDRQHGRVCNNIRMNLAARSP